MTPQERFDRLKKLVESGTVGKVIAHEFGVHNTQVSAACRILGLDTGYLYITEKQKSDILVDYKAGVRLREIAAKNGCSINNISRLAIKAGLRRHEFAVRKTRSKGVSK